MIFTDFQPPRSHDSALLHGFHSGGRKATLTMMKLSNRACAQQSKLSSSKCCRTPLTTLCSNHFSLMLLFCSCYPHHFLLRQSSKVKSLFFPKISSQNPFNIYLMTCMNEKASCMENLVISFATGIITVLIVFALQGHVSKLALV